MVKIRIILSLLVCFGLMSNIVHADVIITPLAGDSVEGVANFNSDDVFSGLKLNKNNKPKKQLNLAIPKQKQRIDYIQERLNKPLYFNPDDKNVDLF